MLAGPRVVRLSAMFAFAPNGIGKRVMISRYNRVFQRLFWLIVLIGTVPAAASTTLPPTHWCLNFADISALFALPSVGCFGGSSIAPDYLSAPFTWVYLALFSAGVLFSLVRKKFIPIIALAPFLLLYASPVTELSVCPEDQITPDFFEPQYRQTSTSIDATVKETLPDINLGTPETEKKYAEVRTLLATAKENADNYWQTVRQIEILEKKLRDERDEIFKLDAALESTQSALKELEKVGRIMRSAAEKFKELIETIQGDKRKKEASVRATEKKIAALKNQQKAEFSSFMANLTTLNSELARSLSPEPKEDVRSWTLIISAASLLSLAFFTFGGHIRNPEFTLASLLVLIAAFNPVEQTTQGVSISQGLFSLLLASYPLVLFVVTAVSLRLFALAILQNISVFQQFTQQKLLSYISFTALRWIPIALCIAGGLWLSLEIDTRAQDAVYGIECTDDGPGIFECDTPTTQTLVVRGEDSNLERDIYNSVDVAFWNQERQLDDMLREYRWLAKSSREEIPAFVDREFKALYPNGETLVRGVPSLQPPDCKLHQVDCHVIRKVKIAIVDAYDFTRERQLNRLHEMTSDFSELSGAEAEKRIREIELYLSATLDATKRSVRNVIADVFWTVRSLNLLATMVLIVAAIKSFAYIFARVAFKSETGNSLPIEHIEPEILEANDITPRIRSGFDPEYIFEPGNFGKIYIKPALSPSGSSQGIAWPQPSKAILRRLVSGTYKMVKVDPNEDRSDTISIQTSQGRQFIEWTLEAGERVYFSQGNLAAFSGTIRLETHVSLSLSAMSFGRMFYSIAEGPGILVLRTFGKPEVYRSGENSRAIDPLRFIGWSDRAHFHINSSSSLENIYFHSAQIRFSHGGAAIGDVSENGKRGAGAIRFIPPVFLPF